jgi:hypothetical protein
MDGFPCGTFISSSIIAKLALSRHCPPRSHWACGPLAGGDFPSRLAVPRIFASEMTISVSGLTAYGGTG